MAKPNYISLVIGGIQADLDPNAQVPLISYALEEEQDFEVKDGGESFDIEMPSTLNNDKIHNTRHNPSIRDSTPGQLYDNFQPAIYKANGVEILIGKYLPQSVITKGRPVRYKGMILGLNREWAIDLQEKTLLDFVNPRTHTFDALTIINSWRYDGRSEANDFIYAPVRYRKAFGETPVATEDNPNPQPDDMNVLISDMKPSISPYWILYRGFKSVGYKLVSKFMDTDYYRRGTLPWTWGGFDYMDDTRWEPLKFLAGQKDNARFEGDHDDEFPNLLIKADQVVPGTYDNSNLFSYTSGNSTLPYMMMWKYPTSPSNLNLGKIKVNLSVQLNYNYKVVQGGDDANLQVFWYKNGQELFRDEIFNVTGHGALNPSVGGGFHESFYEGDIQPGDYIGVRVRVRTFQSALGFARVDVQVQAFQLNFVRLTEGAQVNLKNYPKFNNYKWLDLLRGEVDLFDLMIGTDPVRKEVHIEPAHDCIVDGKKIEGYFNRKQVDWSQKVDIDKESEQLLFSDYEREFEFFFKDDTADGGLKSVQDRNQVKIGKAKYVLPERFKSEKKPQENRFYAPVMHYYHDRFKNITGISPQLIAIIPENVSNTSSSESENIYQPKRAWYKGNVSGVGGWKFNGIEYKTLPFMFAVNYQPGGQNDPVLSYSDQLIGAAVAPGLVKKFFLQRMAIIRNGRLYSPIYIKVNSHDVANFLHRESIVIDGLEYIFNAIDQYNPIAPESTAFKLWMFSPKTPTDAAQTFPSIRGIQSGISMGSFDLKYWPHLLLNSDISA